MWPRVQVNSDDLRAVPKFTLVAKLSLLRNVNDELKCPANVRFDEPLIRRRLWLG